MHSKTGCCYLQPWIQLLSAKEVCPPPMLDLFGAAKDSYQKMLAATCWNLEAAAQVRCMDFFASPNDWMTAMQPVDQQDQRRHSAQADISVSVSIAILTLECSPKKGPCLVDNSSSSWPPQIFSLFQRSLKKCKTKHTVHETRQWMTQVACDIIWVSIICQRPSLSMQGHLNRRKRQGWRMWTKFISEISFHVFGLDFLKLSWPPASCSN